MRFSKIQRLFVFLTTAFIVVPSGCGTHDSDGVFTIKQRLVDLRQMGIPIWKCGFSEIGYGFSVKKSAPINAIYSAIDASGYRIVYEGMAVGAEELVFIDSNLSFHRLSIEAKWLDVHDGLYVLFLGKKIRVVAVKSMNIEDCVDYEIGNTSAPTNIGTL